MNTNQLYIALVLFLAAFLSGFRLHQTGTPRSTLLLTLHKLTILAAAILLWLAVSPLTPLDKAPAAVLICGGLAGLCFLGAVASGGLASITNPPEASRRLHRLLPSLTLLFAALAAYFFAAP